MTYKIVAYAGTFRIKDDLKANGFIYDSSDGGTWIKHHATEHQINFYRHKQYGEWRGIVFTITEEKSEPIDYNPDKFVEQEIEDIEMPF